LLPDFYTGIGMQLQAIAEARTIGAVFARLESDGFLLRVDPTVAPTMMRGAILSETELALLRRIEDVARLGHVRRIERDRIVFEHGALPGDENTVYVHCAAQGLSRPPLRPIFEPDRVTVQPCFWGFVSFQFALLGVVESLIDGVEEKNRLCPPVRYWDTPRDYLSAFGALLKAQQARASYPSVASWASQTRLSPMGAIGRYREHPQGRQALERIQRFGAQAAGNLVKLLATGA